jgi:hypothetical protein
MWTGTTDPTAYPDEPPILGLAPAEQPAILPSTPDLTTPEAAVRVLFSALCQDDDSRLDPLFMPVDDFAQAARTSLDNARERTDEMRIGTIGILAAFMGGSPTERRPGGLAGMLELESISLGSGRLVTGELTDDNQLAVMILGSEMRLHLRDSSQSFVLRVPKLLLSPDGRWQLAEAPRLGGMLELFMAMGLHLSPALLRFEHHPLPYFTGNYWTYRVRGDVPLAEGDDPTYRDEVVSREEFDGYAVIEISRTWSDESRRTRNRHYLLTARRLFRCNADCRRNRSDVSWLLSDLSRRTPVLIFPLRPGIGWRTGGRLDVTGEYAASTSFEVADVPAGRYEQTVMVTNSGNRGTVHRYVVPGIGVVMTRIDGALDVSYEELIDYRVIP